VAGENILARQTFMVGGHEFSTIDSLIIYTKHILGRNLRITSGPDFDWLIELFKRHPFWKEKCGTGISAIGIGRDFNKSFHVTITRKDGTQDSISWKTACSGRARSAKQEKNLAYRIEIEPQIKQFRRETSDIVTCQICQIRFAQPPHVDHSPPFSKLISDYENNHGQITFAQYHQQNAKLSLVCRNCNIEKGTSNDELCSANT